MPHLGGGLQQGDGKALATSSRATRAARNEQAAGERLFEQFLRDQWDAGAAAHTYPAS
ncbi:MAG TPA: hypothetical protein VGD91_29455 [Trebonia sp.]